MLLKYYLKIVFRTMSKSYVLSGINIFSLMVGLIAGYYAFLFIKFELTYDHHILNRDRVYRIIQNENGLKTASTPFPLIKAILNEAPEVTPTLIYRHNWSVKYVKYNEKGISVKQYFQVDSSFFTVFKMKFIEGNAKTVYQRPHTIVLSQTMAKKLFGNENCIGKIISVEDLFGKRELEITGIVKDPPANAHFHFDCLELFYNYSNKLGMPNWSWKGYWIYFTSSKPLQLNKFESHLEKIVADYYPADLSGKVKLEIQLVNKIHLQSHLQNELEKNGNRLYLFLIPIASGLLLLIGCFNFIIILTSRVLARIKNIAIHKIIGAQKFELFKQIATESIFISLIAGIVSVLIIQLSIPYVNRNLFRVNGLDSSSILIFVLFVLILGLGLTVFPSYYLFRIRMANILRDRVGTFKTKSIWRILLICQFLISFIITVSFITTRKQINYMLHKDLGFAKDQIILVDVLWHQRREEKDQINMDAFMNALKYEPEVSASTVIDQVPWGGLINRDFEIYGSDEYLSIPTLWSEDNFEKVFNVQLLDGRSISKLNLNILNKQADHKIEHEFIVNEAAAKELNLTNPVGKRLTMKGFFSETKNVGTVVGLMKNFHFESMHKTIGPLVVIANQYANYAYCAIRIKGDINSQVIQRIESVWKQNANNLPFNYVVLSQDYNKLYANEEEAQNLLSYYSLLSIVTACLGFIALIYQVLIRRIKEIGIRKVLGATENSILKLIITDLMRPVLIASFIAIPISYLLMDEYLNTFAYKISQNPGPFVISTLLYFGLALIAILSQTIKASRVKAVDNLRSD